ncbi:hypothetical protein HDU97_003723 [Phlyctochytrium planicorne]|nr:hypothetical protein HDU97_003723 [Phlyctochytrium planicorne]
MAPTPAHLIRRDSSDDDSSARKYFTIIWVGIGLIAVVFIYFWWRRKKAADARKVFEDTINHHQAMATGKGIILGKGTAMISVPSNANTKKIETYQLIKEHQVTHGGLVMDGNGPTPNTTAAPAPVYGAQPVPSGSLGPPVFAAQVPTVPVSAVVYGSRPMHRS